jgi:signal transduction histidine kinase
MNFPKINVGELFIGMFLLFTNLFFVVAFSLVLMFKEFNSNYIVYFIPGFYFFIIGVGIYFIFCRNNIAFKFYFSNVVFSVLPMLLFSFLLFIYEKSLAFNADIDSLKFIGFNFLKLNFIDNNLNSLIMVFISLVGYDLFFVYKFVVSENADKNFLYYHIGKYFLFIGVFLLFLIL